MQHHILHYLETTERQQFQLLERLILQPSHTSYKEGVDQVGSLLREALADCSLTLTIDHQNKCGNNLVFASAACSPNHPHITLVGHMDTVFPLESSFNYYREDSINAYGPGVCDMKGGLVGAVFLLKALHSQRLLETIPIMLICNSDEETGSLNSAELIKKYGRRSLCGLVFECGGTSGQVVTGRKGKAGYRLDVIGKSAHAAFANELGKTSAILELAHKILHIEQLNDPQKDIVVNVGKVHGGTAANVVAERATAEIDTRFFTDEDGLFCRKNIEEIASLSAIAGTISTIVATNSRLPMMETKKNLALYEVIKKQAGVLGMETGREMRSGVSDANTLAECGIPVVDGLGPIGSLDHSADEYMVKNSLTERCKLATLTALALWQDHQGGVTPLSDWTT